MGVKDLGIPGAKPCEHDRPTFGCGSCISSDAAAWEQGQYTKFCKRYQKDATMWRSCGGCGTKMEPYLFMKNAMNKNRLSAVLSCQRLTGDGEFLCEDHDVFVDIEGIA